MPPSTATGAPRRSDACAAIHRLRPRIVVRLHGDASRAPAAGAEARDGELCARCCQFLIARCVSESSAARRVAVLTLKFSPDSTRPSVPCNFETSADSAAKSPLSSTSVCDTRQRCGCSPRSPGTSCIRPSTLRRLRLPVRAPARAPSGALTSFAAGAASALSASARRNACMRSFATLLVADAVTVTIGCGVGRVDSSTVCAWPCIAVTVSRSGENRTDPSGHGSSSQGIGAADRRVSEQCGRRGAALTRHRLSRPPATRAGSASIASRFDHEKHSVGRRPPGQPRMAQVLARRQHHGHRHVRRRARRRAPCCASCRADSDARHCGKISYSFVTFQSTAPPNASASMPVSSSSSRSRGAREILVLVAASGDRLPMLGKVGALEQQHVQVRRVDDHQHRDRLLVTHADPPLPRRDVS